MSASVSLTFCALALNANLYLRLYFAQKVSVKTRDLIPFRIQIRLYAVEHRQSDCECRACLHIHDSDAAVVRSDNIICH